MFRFEFIEQELKFFYIKINYILPYRKFLSYGILMSLLIFWVKILFPPFLVLVATFSAQSSLATPARLNRVRNSFFQIQLLVDEINLANSQFDLRWACGSAREANNQLLDILPVLQLNAPGLDHYGFHDELLLKISECQKKGY